MYCFKMTRDKKEMKKLIVVFYFIVLTLVEVIFLLNYEFFEK